MWGVIAGSGFMPWAAFEVLERRECDTPWGEPSAAIHLGRCGGTEVAVLVRHGEQAQWPAHRVNYRANIQALADCGVRNIVATGTVGGIAAALRPGVLALPHQLIDYTAGREQSFWTPGEARTAHVDFTEPFSDALRGRLLAAAKHVAPELVPRGVYAVTQGPRLETAAEVDRLERDGADMVGMTAMPEAVLARELDLDYALLAIVVNHAAGRAQAGIWEQVRRWQQGAIAQAQVLLGALLAAPR